MYVLEYHGFFIYTVLPWIVKETLHSKYSAQVKCNATSVHLKRVLEGLFLLRACVRVPLSLSLLSLLCVCVCVVDCHKHTPHHRVAGTPSSADNLKRVVCGGASFNLRRGPANSPSPPPGGILEIWSVTPPPFRPSWTSYLVQPSSSMNRKSSGSMMSSAAGGGTEVRCRGEGVGWHLRESGL